MSGITAVNGGTGITAVTSGGVVTLTNTGVTGLAAGSGISLSGSTGTVTISATGSGGGGVTTATAGTGISVSASTGAVTFTNTGVTSLTAGSGITLSGSTGAVTISSTGGGGGGISSVGTTGAGLSASTTSGAVTLQNTGVTSIVAGSGVTISGATGAVTINAPGGGSGISSVSATGAGITASTTGGAVTIANTGVTSAAAGAGIGVSAASGAVTFSNTGVTSLTAGTNITLSNTTGAVTINATGGGGGGGVTSLTAGTGITLSGSTGAVTVGFNGTIVTAQNLVFSGTTNTTAQGITLASGVAPSNGYFTYVVSNATYTAAQAQQLVPTTGTAGVAGDIFQWTGTAFVQFPQNVLTGAGNQLGYYAAAGQVLSPLTLGTNLSITGSTLNASGGGGSGVGVAQNLAAGGWDFGMLPSGTVSTAGVWTIASGGLPSIYRGYAYFPAGAITAGAGTYWCVGTSTSACNVYQAQFGTNGFPIPPTTLTAVTGTNTAYTQTTGSVNLFSLALYPSVTLGNYGHVQWASYTNFLTGTNNNIYFDVSASNTGVGTYNLGFAGGSYFQFELFNQGTASQILASRISVIPEPTATTSINTSATCYLRIGISIGAATNSFSFAGNSFTAFVGV